MSTAAHVSGQWGPGALTSAQHAQAGRVHTEPTPDRKDLRVRSSSLCKVSFKCPRQDKIQITSFPERSALWC